MAHARPEVDGNVVFSPVLSPPRYFDGVYSVRLVSGAKSRQMTESSAETAPKAAKELLALDPKQEAEFKSKVREARRKKNKANAEGKPAKVGFLTRSEAPSEEEKQYSVKVRYIHVIG